MTHVIKGRKHFIIAKHVEGNRYKTNEFAVAVLEKVAKLDDEEEVAELVEDAQGRRAFDFPPSVF